MRMKESNIQRGHDCEAFWISKIHEISDWISTRTPEQVKQYQMDRKQKLISYQKGKKKITQQSNTLIEF